MSSITVAKLIKLLSKENPRRIVVLSADSEGNSYSTLGGLEQAAYKSGEIGLEKLDQEAIIRGYSEEDVLVGGKPALVLYP